MSKIDQVFYENGTPKHVIPYNGEFIDGIAEYFHSNGRLRCRIAYNMGNVVDGVVPVIDEDGEVFRIDVWKGGHCEVYTVDHKLLGKFSLFNGKAEGEEVWYHPNGVLKETAFCKDGKIFRRRNFVDGFIEGLETLYHENGLLAHAYFANKDVVEGTDLTYDEKGNLYRTTTFANSQKEGPRRYYDENGMMRAEELFSGGLRNGPTRVYDEKGRLCQTIMYVDDVECGQKSFCYHENGQLDS